MHRKRRNRSSLIQVKVIIVIVLINIDYFIEPLIHLLLDPWSWLEVSYKLKSSCPSILKFSWNWPSSLVKLSIVLQHDFLEKTCSVQKRSNMVKNIWKCCLLTILENFAIDLGDNILQWKLILFILLYKTHIRENSCPWVIAGNAPILFGLFDWTYFQME